MVEAKNRSLGRRLADRQFTKYYQLSAPTNDYTVTEGLRIPMRDAVTLLATLLEPKGPVKGTLLMTSPYGWEMLGTSMTGGVFAGRGYRVLLVCARGTYGSGGDFEPFTREVEDGADIVAWMRTQPWFDGSFATQGYSYIGFTQWALLMDPPPEMVTAVIACTPHAYGSIVRDRGAFLLAPLFEWSFAQTKAQLPVMRRMYSIFSAKGRIKKALGRLPLADAARDLMGDRAPWYQEWISRTDPSDPLWKSGDLTEALEQVGIPVLLEGGWQDMFGRHTVAQYARLADRGLDVGLTMGPWTHAEGGAKGARVLMAEALDWLDEHLAGSGFSKRATPVRMFVNGPGGGWRDLPAWPPATVEQVLYPRSTKDLTDRPAKPGEVSTFTYDPSEPTPTYGGAFVTTVSPGLKAGYQDDSALASRSDVLTFTAEPLTAELEIVGSPVVEVSHSSDNPFADLFVRISEIDTKGRSRNVSDGFIRLDPSEPSGIVRLELDPVAHRFKAGNRVRLIVAGGSHPHWERNLGTGDDPATSTRMLPSRRIVDLSLSRLVLPVAQPSTS